MLYDNCLRLPTSTIVTIYYCSQCQSFIFDDGCIEYPRNIHDIRGNTRYEATIDRWNTPLFHIKLFNDGTMSSNNHANQLTIFKWNPSVDSVFSGGGGAKSAGDIFHSAS